MDRDTPVYRRLHRTEKNEKLNFTDYTFTPHPLKGATLFKIDEGLAAFLVKAHHNLGLLEGLPVCTKYNLIMQ